MKFIKYKKSQQNLFDNRVEVGCAIAHTLKPDPSSLWMSSLKNQFKAEDLPKSDCAYVCDGLVACPGLFLACHHMSAVEKL